MRQTKESSGTGLNYQPSMNINSMNSVNDIGSCGGGSSASKIKILNDRFSNSNAKPNIGSVLDTSIGVSLNWETKE